MLISFSPLVIFKIFEVNSNSNVSRNDSNDTENQCQLENFISNRKVVFVKNSNEIKIKEISKKLDALFNQIDAVRSVLEVLDRRITNAEESLKEK